MVLRPSTKIAEVSPAISLENMIPKAFGDWREEPQKNVQVVNPQTQALLNKLYSQIVSRVYVNPEGYRIMLSVAYGSDQRGSLQAHKPEVCYRAFVIPDVVLAVSRNPATFQDPRFPPSGMTAQFIQRISDTGHCSASYYSTVTDFARLRRLSTSVPFTSAT
ncbi:MAG: exosortase C-terminal domain/associated protein EpsI [Georgfuchsia sp.]